MALSFPFRPHIAIVVNEHIRRLDVLMNEAVPMHLANCYCQANGDSQEASKVGLPLVSLKNLIQWLTARVIQYENRLPFATSERQWPSRPSGIEFGCERVFVLEPPEYLRRRLFCSRGDCQDWRWVAMLPR